MNRLSFILLSILCLYGCSTSVKPTNMPSKAKKLVIAHRGASGYLPEHTMASKAMAYAMKPNFIEQDLVLSKDDIPIVIHDIVLETVTDVTTKFPNRNRSDGKYYVIDFTFEELSELNVFERIDNNSGKAVYRNRFPLRKSTFKLHSLQEEIEMIQGLNKSTKNNIGIYPEIKEPAFHLKEGKDISKIVLNVLTEYGYVSKNDKCMLQCFDVKELKRIRQELRSNLFLVQLIEFRNEEKNIDEYATYADGIGPWYKQMSVNFVKEAHEVGLKVHAYTFRADDLADFESFEALLNYGFNTLDLDGLFTDFPDKAVSFLQKQDLR